MGMAARLTPSSDGKLLGNLATDFDYLVTGRVRDYLRIHLDIDGKRISAFVPHTLGGRQLLVPAAQPTTTVVNSGASEAAAAATLAAQAATAAAAAASAASDTRIDMLEKQVQALQTELTQMRSMLSAVGAMFNPPSN